VKPFALESKDLQKAAQARPRRFVKIRLVYFEMTGPRGHFLSEENLLFQLNSPQRIVPEK
jgi:hypothetical protein